MFTYRQLTMASYYRFVEPDCLADGVASERFESGRIQ